MGRSLVRTFEMQAIAWKEATMRLRNGKYECVQCGAQLDIPADVVPLVYVRTTSESGAIRSIVYEGKEVHSCPIGRSSTRQMA